MAAPVDIKGNFASGIVINGRVGDAITTVTPTLSGGDATKRLTLTGKLPAGVAFDTNTGALSGTPIENGHFRGTIKYEDLVSSAYLRYEIGIIRAVTPQTYGPGYPVNPPVTPATPIAGLTPTAFATAPTVQFHPHTATRTLRADSTFQGYISGNTLTVTTISPTTSRGIVGGLVIKTGAAAGTKILNAKATNASGGQTGDYWVDIAQTVGSLGSPATFTVAGDQVVAATDLRGNGNLASLDGSGPMEMTDAYGRKFWRFQGNMGNLSSWLRNTTLGGLDASSMSWLAMGRDHNDPSSGFAIATTLAAMGAKELSTGDVNFPIALGLITGTPCTRSVSMVASYAGDPALPRMMTGTQLACFASFVANSLGHGASGNGTTKARTYHNETYIEKTITAGTRPINVTGYTLGTTPAAASQPSISGTNSPCFVDIYELVGWLNGEMGTDAQMLTRCGPAVTSALTNWAIPAIRQSLTVFGDSRTAYSSGSQYINYSQDGTNTSLSSLLGEPGVLPADVRVRGFPQGGRGVGYMDLVSDQIATTFGTFGSTTAPGMLLGGGNDYFSFFMFSNEANSQWPSTTFNGGTYANTTLQFAQDVYGGTYGSGYTGSFNPTVSAGSTALTLTAKAGVVSYGSYVSNGGWEPGAGIAGGSGTAYTLFQKSLYAHTTAETTTVGLRTYTQTVTKLLARGLKGLWMTETASGPAWGTVDGGFRSLVTTSGLTDCQAGTGGTYQGKLIVGDPLTQITKGGVKVFDPSGWTNATGEYADNIHFSWQGRKDVVTGADTPQFGLAAQVAALLKL